MSFFFFFLVITRLNRKGKKRKGEKQKAQYLFSRKKKGEKHKAQKLVSRKVSILGGSEDLLVERHEGGGLFPKKIQV